ncbi:receptor-like protein kinase [Seminavis robusta]|uniref:Receptor-like protein kinase n=1 Tax=Seminavis robusta TaxID=568900 RepID=A0A9N8DLU6_9STRA|nr:receptor-like protein kinase [Seminavis robusta]|eukprot:Sro153_g069650.1 receptor-like protein kinase (974) ;mRNA; f:20437-23452
MSMSEDCSSIGGGGSVVDLEEVWRSGNVRWEEQIGSLTLSQDTITFVPAAAITTVTDEDNDNGVKSWSLGSIKRYTVSAAASTINLRVQGAGEDEETTVSFGMESLPKVVELRKALVSRLVRLQSMQKQQQTAPSQTDVASEDQASQEKDDAATTATSTGGSESSVEVLYDASVTPPYNNSPQSIINCRPSIQMNGSTMLSAISINSNTSIPEEEEERSILNQQEEDKKTQEAKSSTHSSSTGQTSESSGNDDENEQQAIYQRPGTIKELSPRTSKKRISTRPASTNRGSVMHGRPSVAASFQQRRGTVFDQEATSGELHDDDMVAREVLQMAHPSSQQQQQQQPSSDTNDTAGMTIEEEKERTRSNLPVKKKTNESTASEELERDDMIAREILQITRTHHQQQELSNDTTGMTMEEIKEKERTRSNMPAVPVPVLQQADADMKRAAVDGLIADNNSTTRTGSSSSLSDAQPQRGPGAYNRAPGQCSCRNIPVSFRCVGTTGKGDYQKSSEPDLEDTIGEEDSGMNGSSNHTNGTSQYRRVSSAQRRSSFFDASSGTVVEACLVEDIAPVRFSEVIPSCVEVKNEEDLMVVDKKTTALVGGACCFFLVAILVTVIVLIATTTASGSGSDSATTVTTSEARVSLVTDLTVPLVADPTEWDVPLSPASRALDWMIGEDPLRETATLQDPDKIRQRFVLVLFYHRTTQQQSGWKRCNPPETGEGRACRHVLLESYSFQGEYFDQHMSEPSFRWMTDTDECRWAGVRCSDGVHVSHLQLGDYGLAGSLPIELSHLYQLEELDLQQNSLDGTLPAEYKFGATADFPSKLKVLRLDRNKFSGEIPEEWCHRHPGEATASTTEFAIETWSLASNQLVGSLPSCLENLQQLKDFNAAHNRLTGTIPPVGGSKLEQLHLTFNSLSGSIPNSFCDGTATSPPLSELSVDCLDGTSSVFVECPCCTKCCDPQEDVCEVYPNDEP